MSIDLAIIPIERLASPRQRFRCEPYSAVLMAGACVLRQRAVHEHRGGGKSTVTFVRCVQCADGARVAKRVGNEVRDIEMLASKPATRRARGAAYVPDGTAAIIARQRQQAAALDADLAERIGAAAPAPIASPFATAMEVEKPAAVAPPSPITPAPSDAPDAPTTDRSDVGTVSDEPTKPRTPKRVAMKEEPEMPRCEWTEAKCSDERSGGASKFAHLCSRHRSVMYVRESNARHRGPATAKPKAATRPATTPPPISRTAKAKSASSAKASPLPAADVSSEELRLAGELLSRCAIVVARLGGLKRCEALADLIAVTG